jgi:hypothetical protein
VTWGGPGQVTIHPGFELDDDTALVISEVKQDNRSARMVAYRPHLLDVRQPLAAASRAASIAAASSGARTTPSSSARLRIRRTVQRREGSAGLEGLEGFAISRA